jgi:two-component system catabolic regulation response regulator CreB/two-component system response regulator ChvI
MRRKKILLVDDEYDITLALKMYLESQRFHVDTFTDPTRALSQFKADFTIYVYEVDRRHK